MKMIAVLALGFGIPAAATAASPNRAEVIVPLGETGRLTGVTVRPIEVVEDSRCPRDVLCVHAGRLRLRVAISGLGERVLTLHEPYRLRSGGTLTLVSASPDRWQSAPPPGTDPAWRFGFRRARR